MTEANQPEPWSVDPTLRFDRIHVIESLNTGFAGRSGRRLAEELQTFASGGPVKVMYHPVDDKDLFRAVMLAIVAEAQAGHYPLIHIEAHGAQRAPGRSGTSRGIELASGEVISWTEIAPFLTEINRTTRLRLLVYVATCFGADIATLVRPTERAPARMLIGPRDSISVGELEVGTNTFYRSLFQEGDGGQALRDMNEATDHAFFPLSAEWLFLQILEGYFNEYTTPDQIAIRAKRTAAHMVMNGAQAAMARRQMHAFLSDRKLVFDTYYRRFFFVDEQPEIADRFRMTYQACFQEASGTDDSRR
jgi:hypothetical protein